METEKHSALAQPIPIILCGKSLENGAMVAQFLKSEFEVIHFVSSFEQAKAEFAELIAGRAPKLSISENIGTQNYSKLPLAIVFGRAYDPDDVTELNRIFRGTGSAPLAWIAGNRDVRPPAQLGPGYAEKAAENTKRAFERWKDSGSISEDIVYY
ncbi:uncharacterized protein TRUGW13939_01864 [Talaromyces rugulosus]|uniref:Uncharacterized protein n=1 Tax=Talaromyces rugulosus TaxID=121627 RepID=A0A7H8QMK7_TALRU|nr:uncharacterized protein TRUGW13939_01864 [Talaromyces rugulosus]QKX54775.1 hypothetical protein TRUGW13939_01864 [Talaromyces rugulosus]